eukprot:GDKJ01054125.1.p1 GENE.GDKJ01054125.1~~GDKJ01054125.1.p1  ORF type:complete len:971 (-),score=197.62 GDKJ01054125.1:472-3384(-)
MLTSLQLEKIASQLFSAFGLDGHSNHLNLRQAFLKHYQLREEPSLTRSMSANPEKNVLSIEDAIRIYGGVAYCPPQLIDVLNSSEHSPSFCSCFGSSSTSDFSVRSYKDRDFMIRFNDKLRREVIELRKRVEPSNQITNCLPVCGTCYFLYCFEDNVPLEMSVCRCGEKMEAAKRLIPLPTQTNRFDNNSKTSVIELASIGSSGDYLMSQHARVAFILAKAAFDVSEPRTRSFVKGFSPPNMRENLMRTPLECEQLKKTLLKKVKDERSASDISERIRPSCKHLEISLEGETTNIVNRKGSPLKLISVTSSASNQDVSPSRKNLERKNKNKSTVIKMNTQASQNDTVSPLSSTFKYESITLSPSRGNSLIINAAPAPKLGFLNSDLNKMNNEIDFQHKTNGSHEELDPYYFRLSSAADVSEDDFVNMIPSENPELSGYSQWSTTLSNALKLGVVSRPPSPLRQHIVSETIAKLEERKKDDLYFKTGNESEDEVDSVVLDVKGADDFDFVRDGETWNRLQQKDKVDRTERAKRDHRLDTEHEAMSIVVNSTLDEVIFTPVWRVAPLGGHCFPIATNRVWVVVSNEDLFDNASSPLTNLSKGQSQQQKQNENHRSNKKKFSASPDQNKTIRTDLVNHQSSTCETHDEPAKPIFDSLFNNVGHATQSITPSQIIYPTLIKDDTQHSSNLSTTDPSPSTFQNVSSHIKNSPLFDTSSDTSPPRLEQNIVSFAETSSPQELPAFDGGSPRELSPFVKLKPLLVLPSPNVNAYQKSECDSDIQSLCTAVNAFSIPSSLSQSSRFSCTSSFDGKNDDSFCVSSSRQCVDVSSSSRCVVLESSAVHAATNSKSDDISLNADSNPALRPPSRRISPRRVGRIAPCQVEVCLDEYINSPVDLESSSEDDDAGEQNILVEMFIKMKEDQGLSPSASTIQRYLTNERADDLFFPSARSADLKSTSKPSQTSHRGTSLPASKH